VLLLNENTQDAIENMATY